MTEKVCIFEDSFIKNLFPLTLTRPVWNLKCGIFSLKDKILRQFSKCQIYLHYSRDYLIEIAEQENKNINVNKLDPEIYLFVNGRVLFNSKLLKRIKERIYKEKLDSTKQKVFKKNGQIVAALLSSNEFYELSEKCFIIDDKYHIESIDIEAKLVNYPWDLINNNRAEIISDFHVLNKRGASDAFSHENAILLNKKDIFIGQNSVIKAGVVLDAESGPIYIDNNVTVMPNAVIQGPTFIGDNSIIKSGAKIYSGTSIGECCKIGGEVEASIIHSHSNKQHDGFLGHAYIGQYVNLGAGTNNSDLKNNYKTVKVQINGELVDSGSMFVGLFMGDHSKSGINTMFNTGTVVGMMSNVFRAGFPPKFIPSFAWCGSESLVEHELEKALATARQVMSRRKKELSPAYEKIIRHIFESTRGERNE